MDLSRRDALKYGFLSLFGIGFIGSVFGGDDDGDENGGGDGRTGDTETPTETATKTPDPPSGPKERVERAARDGLDGSDAHSDEILEISFDSYHDGDSIGPSLDVRYVLDTDNLGLTGSQADDAEFRAGSTARSICSEVATLEDVGDVNSLAIYALVPTKDGGRSVSTKLVIHMDALQSIDYDNTPWQNIRDEHAEQYKFNGYLYE